MSTEPLIDTKVYYDSDGNKAPTIPQNTVHEKQKIHDPEMKWGSPSQLKRVYRYHRSMLPAVGPPASIKYAAPRQIGR